MSDDYLPVTERNTIAIIATLRGEREHREELTERIQALERQNTELTKAVYSLQQTVLALQAEVAVWR